MLHGIEKNNPNKRCANIHEISPTIAKVVFFFLIPQINGISPITAPATIAPVIKPN